MDDPIPPAAQRDLALNWRLSVRAAAVVVHVSQHFSSKIELGHAGRLVDAKSILGILSLAHSAGDDAVMMGGSPYLKAGAQIHIEAHGPDCPEAVRALAEILSRPHSVLEP